MLLERLGNQKLAGSDLRDPAGVVAWCGAVQAQDYPGARWGVGLRMKGADDAGIEQAFDSGRILRTHVMRPTWHFVTPADIRWMLDLTAPRVSALMANYNRQLDLDPRTLVRSNRIIGKALAGQTHLTRAELAGALSKGGITATGQRLGHIMMQAELDGVVCSGPRRGKQFTYALIDERAPNAVRMPRDQALAELTRRFFRSHGPATIRDFVWWSGLTVRDAKAGLEANASAISEQRDGKLTYFSVNEEDPSPRGSAASRAYLLPNYDEYLVAYRDRALVAAKAPPTTFGAAPFPHHVIVDGVMAGGWRRTVRKDSVHVEVVGYSRLSPAVRDAVREAADGYAAFLNVPVTLEFRKA